MKNPMLTIIIFLVLIINAYSQTEDKTITYNRGKYYLKVKYYQDGQNRTRSEIESILATNSASATEYHKYIVTKRVGKTTNIVGSAMVGVGFILLLATSMAPLTTVGTAKETPPIRGVGLTLAGTGIIVVGVVILASNPHFKRSINLYNSSVKSVGSKPVQFNITFNSNGLGMRITF